LTGRCEKRRCCAARISKQIIYILGFLRNFNLFFVLLEKIGLSSRPENTFAILSGLSSVGELERIKTTLKSVALSGESPIEPLIESLPHYDTFVYLFTEYVNNNAVTDEVTQLFTDAFLHEYFEVCEFLYTKYHSNLITDALLIGIKSEKQLTYYCQKLDGMICFYNLIVHDKITSELSKKLNAPLIRDLLELGLSKDNPLILKYFLDHNMIKLEDISLDSISGTQCIQFLAKKQHSNIIPNLDRISSIVGISGSMNIIRNYAKISKEIRVLIKKYPEVNTLKLLYDQMKATEW